MRLRAVWPTLAIPCFLLAAVGCRSNEAVLPPPSASPHRAAVDVAVDSDGACHFDLTGEKADTVFFALGVLDEYLGRVVIEGSDRVESFFCNEAEQARRFRRVVDRLLIEQQIPATVTDETVQSCLHVLHSDTLASRLNSCYRYSFTSEALSIDASGRPHRTATASMSPDLFYRQPAAGSNALVLSGDTVHRRRALAYLAGVWSRFHFRESFAFSNNEAKARLVAHLLDVLGCGRIRIETTVGQAPAGVFVHFTPTDEVREWLTKSIGPS